MGLKLYFGEKIGRKKDIFLKMGVAKCEDQANKYLVVAELKAKPELCGQGKRFLISTNNLN